MSDWHQKGLDFLAKKNKPEALASFDAALNSHSEPAGYRLELMRIAWEQQWPEQVIIWGSPLLEEPATSEECHFLLGRAYRKQFQLTKAMHHFQAAYAINPGNLLLFYMMGKLMYFMGQHQNLIQHFQRAFAPFKDPDSLLPHLTPDSHETLSSWQHTFYALIILALYASSGTDDNLLDHHMKLWAQSFVLVPGTPDEGFPSPTPVGHRRLKVGYISKELGRFSSGILVSQLFHGHDRSRFEIYGFSDTEEPDEATHEFAKVCDHWLVTNGKNNEELYQIIKSLGIDILIDLGGYTHGYRLMLFGMRPAPVQVTGLGFGMATSIPHMHYYISDQWVSPAEHPRQYSEVVYRIPSITQWRPPPFDMPVAPPPCLKNGYITFGSGNAYNKLTFVVLQTWAKILQACPYSRLVLKNPALADPVLRQELQQKFDQLGIWTERLTFLGVSPFSEHLAFHNQIDVALDPFPFNGGVSTCEALWMGVPVITWWDPTRTGTGRTILNTVGHPEWIATTLDDYIALAAQWQHHKSELQSLRNRLRHEIEHSSLVNPTEFIRAVEACYEAMWQQWTLSRG